MTFLLGEKNHDTKIPFQGVSIYDGICWSTCWIVFSTVLLVLCMQTNKPNSMY